VRVGQDGVDIVVGGHWRDMFGVGVCSFGWRPPKKKRKTIPEDDVFVPSTSLGARLHNNLSLQSNIRWTSTSVAENKKKEFEEFTAIRKYLHRIFYFQLKTRDARGNTMSLALLRTSSTARSALRVGATVSSSKAGLVGASFTRGKVTLPDLPCPSIRPRAQSNHN
jgi:hypothetical protein